jgi:hypothetical protein
VYEKPWALIDDPYGQKFPLVGAAACRSLLYQTGGERLSTFRTSLLWKSRRKISDIIFCGEMDAHRGACSAMYFACNFQQLKSAS